jgi:hypothetical protein
LASEATDIPKGQLRHGAFFGKWCKSFFQGCATEPNG